MLLNRKRIFSMYCILQCTGKRKLLQSAVILLFPLKGAVWQSSSSSTEFSSLVFRKRNYIFETFQVESKSPSLHLKIKYRYQIRFATVCSAVQLSFKYGSLLIWGPFQRRAAEFIWQEPSVSDPYFTVFTGKVIAASDNYSSHRKLSWCT